MKLALLAARLPPANDGVGDHADRLARALAAAGHDVVLITAGEAAPRAEYPLEIAASSWGALATARAIAVLRRERVEGLAVEYTPFLYGARSQTPLATLWAASALRVRSVALVHEAFHLRHGWKTGVFAARDSATLACADVIAVPSAARAEALARRLPGARERIAVVPIGANVEPPPFYSRRARTPATIAAFGVVMRRRRVEHAVAALAHLTARGADVRLDIIGRVHDTGYAAEIGALAGRLGVAERIRLRGELTPAELSSALGGAAAAIHTAEEGSIASSGSLLALLAHGVPTVALRTRSDDPVFSGVLHYADDDVELAASLYALMSEPRCAKGLSREATLCYATHFAWPIAAGALCDALTTEAANARLATA